jgi:hypothetical protein
MCSSISFFEPAYSFLMEWNVEMERDQRVYWADGRSAATSEIAMGWFGGVGYLDAE